MMATLVLTVMGPDRPGLVKAISDHVTAYGGNWLGSHMANFEGQFTGIVHLSVPAEKADDLVAALHGLETLGLQVLVAKGKTEAAQASARLVELELVGLDHPGIVRDISRVLSELNISIELLETDRSCSPMSGECLFRARARLQIPADVQTEEACYKLELLANDLMVDINLDEPTATNAKDADEGWTGMRL